MLRILQFESVFTQTSSSAVNINVNYSGPSGGNGWLDNIELVFRCNLNAGSGQFRFRDSRAVGEQRSTPSQVPVVICCGM